MKGMLARSGLAALWVLVSASCSDSTGPGDKQETFEWNGTVAAGDVVEVKGINGGIRALPSTGDAVRIVATKRGSDDDPSTVSIEVVEHDGGVTVCAVYPDVPGEPANECLPGEGGFLSNRGNDVSVAFDVEVPTSALLVGVTVAGSITATGMGEDVYATTVDGHIDLSTDGQARGTTVNGDVDVSLGQADWSRDLSFVTVNGDVTVRVPTETNAQVTAATVNGSVSSEFGLTISGDGRLMTGTLNAGGRLLTLTTVNGDVALLER